MTTIYKYDMKLWFDENPKEYLESIGDIDHVPAIGENVIIDGVNYNVRSCIPISDNEVAWCAKRVDLDYSGETSEMTAPICPHCGYHDGDYWEWRFTRKDDLSDVKEADRDCANCNHSFHVEQEVTVTYTTTKR